jgi:hypothetical protein
VDTAAEVLADVLAGYDVPTGQIVAEFRGLISDPANAGATATRGES